MVCGPGLSSQDILSDQYMMTSPVFCIIIKRARNVAMRDAGTILEKRSIFRVSLLVDIFWAVVNFFGLL
jgi:uncharacterized membrane protein